MPLGIILFSICLFFSYYEVTGLFIKYPQLMWLNAPLLFAIGPLFYWPVQRKWKWTRFLHLIPSFIIFFWLLPFYIKSSSEKLELIKNIFDHIAQPGIELMQYLYLLHIGFYFLLGYFTLRKRNKKYSSYSADHKQYELNQKSAIMYLVIATLTISSFSICFASDISGNYYGQMDRFTILLLVVFALGLQVYFSYTSYDMKLESNFYKPERPAIKTETPESNVEQKHLMLRLDHLMKKEHLYRNPDLKIDLVADKLNVSLHLLSATINGQTNNNFFYYVNSLRVNELKKNLLLENNSNFTLFAIGKESGFNSHSSFYRVFKQFTGCTPKEYIKKHKT